MQGFVTKLINTKFYFTNIIMICSFWENKWGADKRNSAVIICSFQTSKQVRFLRALRTRIKFAGMCTFSTMKQRQFFLSPPLKSHKCKQVLRLSVELGAKFWGQRFRLKIIVLPRATFLVSTGNTIVVCNFGRFAAMTSKADKLPLEWSQLPVITTHVERHM